MGGDPLPNDDQRRRLCELIHEAFLELKGVCHEAEQVHELAYAFHNLPLTIYGRGTWSWDGLRGSAGSLSRAVPQGRSGLRGNGRCDLRG